MKVATGLHPQKPVSRGIPIVSQQGQAPVKIAVHGAAGRMGIRILQLLREDPRTQIVAALDRAGHPSTGRDIAELIGAPATGILLSDSPENLAGVDAVIDFSAPQATMAIAEACARQGIALVVGTTGLEPEQKEHLKGYAGQIPLLVSPNVSRAVNVLMALVKQAAGLLPHADIEIVERHHKFKKDAPAAPPSVMPTLWLTRLVWGPKPMPTAAKASRANAPPGRSACTPCAPATTLASTLWFLA